MTQHLLSGTTLLILLTLQWHYGLIWARCPPDFHIGFDSFSLETGWMDWWTGVLEDASFFSLSQNSLFTLCLPIIILPGIEEERLSDDFTNPLVKIMSATGERWPRRRLGRVRCVWNHTRGTSTTGTTEMSRLHSPSESTSQASKLVDILAGMRHGSPAEPQARALGRRRYPVCCT